MEPPLHAASPTEEARMVPEAKKPVELGDPAQHEDGSLAAKELRSLLPRVWRHFHGPSSSRSKARGAKAAHAASQGGKAQVASVTFSVEELRGFLRTLKRPSSRCAVAQTADGLATVVGEVARLPRLCQRLGFRFQDPSESGTWSAENLVGYRERQVGVPENVESEVAWDYYGTSFKLQLLTEGRTVRLERTMARQPLSAICEKRKRGHPKGPLVREPMVVTAATRVAQAQDRRKRIRVQKGVCDLLPAVLFRPPSGPQQWTLIYLHGLGSSAMENYSDRPHYFFDGSIALKVVVPTAPSREVSCYDTWWFKDSKGSWKLHKFLSWYDYLSDNGGVREDRLDTASLHVIQRALHGLVEAEAAELGGRTDRVILGGKSQGCCTALDAALTFPRPLGGFIGLVGHLLSCTPVERGGPQRSTPLHFFHEPDDHLMRWKWVSRGEKRLRDAGHLVRSRRVPDPETHSHYIQGVEGQWIRSALRSICKVSSEGDED